MDIDFDLPEVDDATPTAPRVTIVGDTCLNCEG